MGEGLSERSGGGVSAWHEGYEAFKAGKSWKECPDYDMARRLSWQQGWLAAQAHKDRESD